MKLRHRWNLTPAEAVALQERIRHRVETADRLGPVRHVAGVDVGFERDGTVTRVTVHTPYRDTWNPAVDGLTMRTDYPDGRWEMFEYDDQGRVTEHYESYLDLAPPTAGSLPDLGSCKKTVYRPPPSPCTWRPGRRCCPR